MITLQEEIVEPQARQAGTICLVAVFFVLLIACANVANLLLARGATRSRELSVRAALGAGRGRLVRQLMTESFMLAAVGCALGLVLSLWGIQLFRTVIPSDFPRVDTLGIDAKVAVYALVVSVVAGLVFGTAPAVQVTRGKLSETLAEGGRGGSSGVRHRRLRTAFVVGEVALAQVLLISAGLMIKGAIRMQMTPLGFDRERSLAFGVTLGLARVSRYDRSGAGRGEHSRETPGDSGCRCRGTDLTASARRRQRHLLHSRRGTAAAGG